MGLALAIYRVFEDGKWVVSPGKSRKKGNCQDSLVYRHARTTGFLRSLEAEAETARSPAIQAAHLAARHQSAAKHKVRVTLFGKFECFVEGHMRETDFYQLLVKLRRAHAALESGEMPEKIQFQEPSEDLVLVYAQVLRGNPDGTSVIDGVDGRFHKHGTIKAAIGAIHSTHDEFLPGTRGKVGPLLKCCLGDWVGTDKVKQAPAFDMVDDMIQAWHGLSSSTWAPIDQLKWWSMLLVAIVVMGRLTSQLVADPGIVPAECVHLNRDIPERTPEPRHPGARRASIGAPGPAAAAAASASAARAGRARRGPALWRGR
ncbi:hypothetical protein M885DRAFT_119800 [Pelagophyceae sp. CCMP2097]|nr:hypothetical protein M885DRAFT_119800 [Pelagophyceae sp. CCMP2097]